MAWTDPPSYTNGQIVTQTDLHVGLRDNMRELYHPVAYVEFNADVPSTAAEATPTDVVSSGAVTYPAYPILIEFFAPGITIPTGGALNLWDGSTDLGRLTFSGAIGTDIPAYAVRRLTPTAASHTYKVRLWSSSGTNTVRAGAGGTGVLLPGYIQVWQRGG